MITEQTKEQQAASPAETTTPEVEKKRPPVLAKIRNDAKAVRVVTSIAGNAVNIAPGETKTVRMSAANVDWLQRSPDLKVLSRDDA